MNLWNKPSKEGLYDPSMEHDACGVGFVANVKGEKSHKIIQDGLQILVNLSHRGACGCDPRTGDGAGLLMQMPDKFFRKVTSETSIGLPAEGDYGAGLIFLPTQLEEKNQCEEWFEQIIHEEGQVFLGWRDVPHDSEQIGYMAHSVEPEQRQIFIGRSSETKAGLDFERKLYVIRKRLENKVRGATLNQAHYFYVCSLSSRTFIYKGQLMPEQVDPFFQDLGDPDMESCMALVHSRYSTNTFPSWPLAHPYRMLAHNGEINTLRGNINWMHARECQFVSEVFDKDLEKIMPVVAPGGSDSATLDNALEMLVLAGRSLPHAMMMMIPEAWSGHEGMSQEKKDFYEYHACLMEPWDGPASIAFTDGRYVGAVLDRNGLRPSRYTVTKNDMVIMASETGVLEVPPEMVLSKGRLQPGKMFLVDTQEGRIIDDQELKHTYANRHPYGEWLEKGRISLEDLPKPANVIGLQPETLLSRQQAFGYSMEDIKFLIKPMVEDGKEATASMGNDTPLAALSNRPRLLFDYFKQLFAQVTNPPVDAIREELIMGSDVFLGGEFNLLEETADHCQRLRLKDPIITNEALEKIRALDKPNLKAITLPILYNSSDGPAGLQPALQNLFDRADQAIQEGHTLLILSDRKVNRDRIPVPSLLACAGLHHHLIRTGNRTRVSLIMETGEAREMQHFATLIGYGANAVNPYLAFETILHELQRGMIDAESEAHAIKNYIKASRLGLYKVMSKMGISTIQSYCGAQIFEAVGLGDEVIENYFTATPSRVGGINLDVIAQEVFSRFRRAFPKGNANPFEQEELELGGQYQWRKEGEFHQVNPESVSLLQHAVRTGDFAAYKRYADCVNDQSVNLATLRGLLNFKPGNTISLDEVEPASEIVKRFATGAMSYGSISKEAHETLAIAMNRLGGFSNTGEGGEDPARFVPDANGDSRRSRIKQVAQGRFGVTLEYLVNADQLQIKMAQGAKPGEGGQLPGHKVSKEIAATRFTTPGVQLISPPPHHDIYSIEDLAQLIHDLKNSNRQADISVKLVAEYGVGTVAAGVSKGKSDHVLISGHDGGTGASPATSVKHAGLPWELGLAETQQVLVMNDLRGRIRVQTDGQMKTGRDVVIGGLLGADEFGFSTMALVSMGCVMLRKCHMNTCSVGIATQDPELRKMFAGQPAHVVNFFTFVAEEVREIMAEMGVRKFEDLIGRMDYLKPATAINHWKAKGIDLTRILHKPDVPRHIKIRHEDGQDHGLEKALDVQLLEWCKPTLENKTSVILKDVPIKNINRTVGTILSSDCVRKWGYHGLEDDTIQIHFLGSAGQSFAAFLAKGISLALEGDANDYFCKGLSGGQVVIYPPKNATYVPEDNIIIGNVAFYGAIKGESFIRGLAGERFCVRNSGAHTVVEGIGDHGCEYMTGGRVVILGETGRNFAAGMSGGIAYIWDKNGNFEDHCNMEMVELFAVEEEEDISFLKSMIEKQAKYTGSTVAEDLLKRFKKVLPQFVKVYPTDYRRVLEEAKQGVNSDVHAAVKA